MQLDPAATPASRKRARTAPSRTEDQRALFDANAEPPQDRTREGRVAERDAEQATGRSRPKRGGNPPKAAARVPPGGEEKDRRAKETAESMGARQRDISVSEFFAKNRHLLGFDNPAKSLLTTIK